MCLGACAAGGAVAVLPTTATLNAGRISAFQLGGVVVASHPASRVAFLHPFATAPPTLA
jgi:hypothetical protein